MPSGFQELTCTACRGRFWGEHWKTLCKPCFIRSKRLEEAQQRNGWHVGYETGWRDGYNLGHSKGKAEAAALPRGPQLDWETLDRIRRLTHPDRHSERLFAEANELTATINTLMAQAAR